MSHTIILISGQSLFFSGMTLETAMARVATVHGIDAIASIETR